MDLCKHGSEHDAYDAWLFVTIGCVFRCLIIIVPFKISGLETIVAYDLVRVSAYCVHMHLWHSSTGAERVRD